MARISEGYSSFHRICVTNFTDENHIWCLSHGTLQCSMKGMGVEPNFSLINDRLLMGMDVFNGVFDCNDMARTSHVTMVDHCRKRGRFSGARRTDNKNQPPLGHNNILEDRGESKLFKSRDFNHD